ncbi:MULTISPECIES: sugar transferase [Streptomyces]|uniref:Exopolysaccharide biosynthesis polyprenyl glycosylphosphotransferase n=1 Tax=Streptomyces venezuelae TaxID=54571 RepID=A0A5P2B555_STRVZ|nr:sugar transferase [Streptomyces venezuelae]MYY84955.1 exopolysaccharide biosynthesis polyprenyl glycosylphosphotransferase [Streptomyces sp. SID335]MYZ16817.1 exopolysaccharide biosynthesis polyprenyl glycosylphosphotransferase [Streptomyces sp. SID337]NDZ83977.1 sugar transferase [Streptomyces sp. SID10115]NEA00204.1 sugar transferase [Streptomyces sp. SID10116]NEB45293.1 sugar transferase [Streptomyces sp. SID339]
MRQGGLVSPFPSARGRLANGAISEPATEWEQRYRRTVITSDTVATAFVVAGIGIFFGARDAANWHEKWGILAFGTELLVLGALAVSRAWSPSVLGQGAEEFRRLGRSLFTAVVVLALGGIALTSRNIKLWIFVAIPAIGLVTMTARYLLRLRLHRQRQDGRCLRPVLAAGSPETVSDLITRARKFPHLGWRVEAVCTADGLGPDGDHLDGVPIVGGLADVANHVRRDGYRVVAVTPDPHWSPDRLQRLAWNLEGSDAEMVVAPVLMEVAGPRLHVDAVLGIPLLRVSMPTFTGGRRVVKGIVDRLGAAFLLILFAPLMVLVGLLVLADSRGGALYRQRRVGKDGREFTIFKFRTMVTGAHDARAQLADRNEGAGLLFKLRRDPRVTRVGAVLRRYSIDELPQLFNVLTGSMSLVGPRPPLPEESAAYGPDIRRRLLVKPGLTGLWQISGRSDLPWEEAVRLDLRYVEDWSLALDTVILWKTLRAVIHGQGAY